MFKRKNKTDEESDFGRTYGWFIERDGTRIGEMDYIRWDSQSQFWHEYRLTWHDPNDTVKGPDAWLEAGLVLRNRKHTEVIIKDFLASPEREPGVIAIRGAQVPSEKL